jgi:hypothetical protein
MYTVIPKITAAVTNATMAFLVCIFFIIIVPIPFGTTPDISTGGASLLQSHKDYPFVKQKAIANR